jgi:hypothetical protein
MASTCSQLIVDRCYPHASTVESGFRFLKPPPSSDVPLFGGDARFQLYHLILRRSDLTAVNFHLLDNY